MLGAGWAPEEAASPRGVDEPRCEMTMPKQFAETRESLHALAEHVLAATGDSFWNQPFGATVTWEDIRSVEDAVEFFRQGRQHAAG
jgi:hypothetical protein